MLMVLRFMRGSQKSRIASKNNRLAKVMSTHLRNKTLIETIILHGLDGPCIPPRGHEHAKISKNQFINVKEENEDLCL